MSSCVANDPTCIEGTAGPMASAPVCPATTSAGSPPVKTPEAYQPEMWNLWKPEQIGVD